MNRTTRNACTIFALATFACLATVHGAESARPESAKDPFAAAAGAAAPAGNPFRPGGNRYAAAPVSAAPADAAKAQCDQALLDARRALSVGDLPRALQFLDRAQQLKVVYEGPGDSPQSVAESIREFQEISTLRATGGKAWRMGYAKFLVKQADALVAYRDLETAGRAATEAKQLLPQWNGAGTTPDDVLRRVEQIRKESTTLAVAPSQPAGDAKAQTLQLLAQARAALAAGKLAEAQALAGKASALNVPDSQFGPDEDRPGRLALDLQKAMAEGSVVQLAGGLATTATPQAGDLVKAASASDTSAVMHLAQAPEAAPLPLPGAGEEGAAPPSEAFNMLEAGEQALKSGDRKAALDSFRAAYEKRAELDLLSQQRLQGHLQMLSASEGAQATPDGELLDSAAAGQSVLVRQISADVGKRQSEAAKVRESDPNQSLKLLAEARAMVEDSELNETVKGQLIKRIELSVSETEAYIKAHKSELDLEATNREIMADIERERAVKAQTQTKMAELVDQFNKLVDEQRFAEAEVVANRLYEMAPDELVAQQINKQAKMIRRERWSRDIREESENGVANTLLTLQQDAAEALDDQTSDIAYGANWESFKDRKRSSDIGSSRNVKELEIEQKLKTPVLPKYSETPLTMVVEQLSQLAGVNIHLDPRGLSEEGVRSDTPITLNLPQEISLKSALTLILEPLHLTYTIQDEVLKITSEQIRDGEVYIRTYPVGDLVVPIPNFVPSNNMGLQGLINDAYASLGAYGPGAGAPGPIAVVANGREGQRGVALPENVMGQQMGMGAKQPSSVPLNSGPGGLGGAASADFDSLIDLIVSTVEHDSWMENGTGEGEIQPFPTNLSLVISQTQRVHEQIADLLDQLRRLQDLQVTIEVRFIRLTDNFFERIGVDFDFNIRNKDSQAILGSFPGGVATPGVVPNNSPSSVVGLAGAAPDETLNPNYTVDLDLPFRQGSFALSAPQFGSPNDVGSFGFAILSDIEAFFVINASQGDQRGNVLQAPKVTLFNGQQAFVVDSAFRPFVISVIPVVGEFAAAQQPVIVVLSEGTMLTVQAVVSDDRRYVRLTLVPFFSQVGDVQEFTFEGSETTSTSEANSESGDDESSEEAEEVTRSGTTVQLPTFEVISVATTVSVPDGGTVLLGGIKRLREGRNEFGIPLLSKVPYVDRLFRNVGIGREADSLMMMVTPHIIIQEEEEERLGVVQNEGP
ncbi:MAG: general secretion pathway protein GspD [Planctomycetota bacterium]|nr:MAG: general secretion pathway protein GspD [Planctomycetota bacterium]